MLFLCQSNDDEKKKNVYSLNHNIINQGYLVFSCTQKDTKSLESYVVNNGKGRISKRVFQENKARQIFCKTNISYPLIRTRTCTYQVVRNIRFAKKFRVLFFLKHPFWDSSFCLITDGKWNSCGHICMYFRPVFVSNLVSSMVAPPSWLSSAELI